MSSLQIFSDLHLEIRNSYDDFKITPTAPHLAIIGDIGCVRDPGYLTFIERQLSLFQTVFLVLGNHEPYHSNWTKIHDDLRRFQHRLNDKKADKNLGSFIILDQTRYDVTPTTTILGCTLHSSISPFQMNGVSNNLNDFSLIDDWTVEQHNEAHTADLAWLNAQVESIARTEPDRRIIVLTHHSPSTASDAVDPKYTQSPVSSAFSTDSTGEVCWNSRNVIAWAFGHTHFNCDFTDEVTGKRVLTNQRGYDFDLAAGFDGKKFIAI